MSQPARICVQLMLTTGVLTITEAAIAMIFLSYRRNDSASVCGRIYDRLCGAFGKDNIFKDVDSIPLGMNFAEYIRDTVRKCAVQIVVIGPRWLDAVNAARLNDPTDTVRREIESALQQGIPVIPVLVQETSIPPASSLPPSLRELVVRNGVMVRDDPNFEHDINRLIAALIQIVPRQAPAGSGQYIHINAESIPATPLPNAAVSPFHHGENVSRPLPTSSSFTRSNRKRRWVVSTAIGSIVLVLVVVGVLILRALPAAVAGTWVGTGVNTLNDGSQTTNPVYLVVHEDSSNHLTGTAEACTRAASGQITTTTYQIVGTQSGSSVDVTMIVPGGSADFTGDMSSSDLTLTFRNPVSANPSQDPKLILLVQATYHHGSLSDFTAACNQLPATA